MTLLEGIDDQQMKLLTIKSRLHVLRAFVEDLEAVTKGKPFRIWDDLAWMMVLDSRDALISTRRTTLPSSSTTSCGMK